MEDVLTIVIRTIVQMQPELECDSLRAPSLDTPLYSEKSELDSLSLVLLVVEIEAEINRVLGKNIVLASEKALSKNRSPYRTVRTLVEFIKEETGQV